MQSKRFGPENGNHKKKQKSMEGKGKLSLEGKRRRIDGREGR
ncbi:hypothetical protein Gotur_021178 [Gossypium turneri]